LSRTLKSKALKHKLSMFKLIQNYISP
jgi:hypothetical protein